MLSLKELTVGKTVTFSRYQKGELWYTVGLNEDDNEFFEFPVPVSDTGDGEFKAIDSAMYFMRWIRQHRDMLIKAKQEQEITLG